MPIIVRKYRPGDAAELLVLFKNSIRKACSSDYNAAQIAAWASDEICLEPWARRFEGRFVVVAEIERIVVGFAELEPDGHIDRFYVSANHQRQGVGKVLLNAIFAQANQWNLHHLQVEASLTARPFFASHGFRTIAPQTVTCRGIAVQNFRMERQLP